MVVLIGEPVPHQFLIGVVVEGPLVLAPLPGIEPVDVHSLHLHELLQLLRRVLLLVNHLPVYLVAKPHFQLVLMCEQLQRLLHVQGHLNLTVLRRTRKSVLAGQHRQPHTNYRWVVAAHLLCHVFTDD